MIRRYASASPVLQGGGAVTRKADSDDDVRAVFNLLMIMHDEQGMAPLDPVKTMQRIYDAVFGGSCFVVDGDDCLVGSIGLVVADYWYSMDKYLTDRWFFVRKEARNGSVGKALLIAARGEAETHGLPLFVNVTNPTRRYGKIGDLVGFFPLGKTLRLR